ncbi:MAG: hypothetical protein AAGF59_08420 [Pseudomonadota bacterium]
MFVQEEMLAGFRDENSLCRLRSVFANQSAGQYSIDLRTKAPGVSKRPKIYRSSEWFEELNSIEPDPPVVALLAYTDFVPILPIVREWIAIQHQSAGYYCRQVVMIATYLVPRPEIRSHFEKIARENYAVCDGYFSDPDSDPEITERYKSRLKEIGLTCSGEAQHALCESIYTVDANKNSLAICFEDTEDLLYLTENESAKPLIAFLTDNSD